MCIRVPVKPTGTLIGVPVMSEPAFDEIRLLKLRQVAEVLGVAPDTINGWVRRGHFPRPIQARPGTPKMWRFTVVRDWLEKRQRSRYVPPTPRGQLKQNQK